MFEFIERIGQKRLDLRYWASMVANPPMCQGLKCRASLFSEPRWRPVGRAVGTAKRSVPGSNGYRSVNVPRIVKSLALSTILDR